jgi:hypothetical protein
VSPGATAGAPFAGSKPLSPLELGEVAEIRIADEDDVAAGTAVAAVRAALGDVLLPAEAQRTVAAAPRLHVDAGAVGKQKR